MSDNKQPILGVFDPSVKKKHPRFRLAVMEESINATATDEVARLPTYQEMLQRAFNLINNKNPDSDERSRRIHLPPLEITRKAKKTMFGNFKSVCECLNRTQEHVKQYICTEQNTESSIDGNGALVITGRLQQTQLERLVFQYVKTYVQCPVCLSVDTKLDRSNRLLFIVCNQCTAQRSVQQIKGGFRANTTKRSTR